MNSLWQLVLARWRSFYREPETIFWIFVFPLILALGLGTAFRNRPPEPIVVGIEDGPSADALAQALSTRPDVKPRRVDAAGARSGLRTGKLDVVVNGRSPRSYTFDPTRPESRTARLLLDDTLQRIDGRVDATPTLDVAVTEPGSRYIDFLMPGLFGLGLMQSGFWGVGYSVVEMRTRKLLKRLAATPMRRRDFLASFVLVRVFFLAAELPVILGFGALVFGVPVRGSIALLVAIATLGSLSFSGIGLLVASRAKTTQTVSGLINLASMPMFLLSGVFFSSARFPDVIQPVVRALPLSALNDALRAVMLEGAGLTDVARPVATLAAWGAVSFAIALRLFRWQ